MPFACSGGRPTAVWIRSLAREVCLRDDSIRALITGRVEKARSRYVVTFTIMNPASGTALATITEEAPNRAQLLPVVRRLAFRVRSTLGETTGALERARQDLERAPVPVLAALSFHAQALVLGSVRDSTLLGTGLGAHVVPGSTATEVG